MHRKPFSLSAGAAAVNADDYYENSKSKRPNVGRNRIMAGIGAVVFILLLTLAYFRGALTEDLPPSPVSSCAFKYCMRF